MTFKLPLLLIVGLFWLAPVSEQGTTVRVELGDATTTVDPTDAHTIGRSFPHTYGQPLAHFLRATAQVPDAHIITDHPAKRYFYKKQDY